MVLQLHPYATSLSIFKCFFILHYKILCIIYILHIILNLYMVYTTYNIIVVCDISVLYYCGSI